VVVVGLGPAGANLLLPAARTALATNTVCYTRTARHPAVQDLIAAGIAFIALDDHYERAASVDDAYRSIVDTLVAAARQHDTVVYAVPGNPVTAERTVALLREAGVLVDIIPGLSFAELAWARLGIDPMATGARIVDGRQFRFSPEPLLIAQCDSPLVLGDVKLALLDALPPEHEVTVVQALGLPTETVTSVALAELDHAVVPDHLTSLFVDGRGTSAGGDIAGAFLRFVELVERLRGPGGCPWDAEQTHHSLTRHLLEESYEVVEAIEALPVDAPGPRPDGEPVPAGAYDHLEEELGDLLFQVVFHTTLAREAGAFTMADVANGIHDKLVHRHPHVFGDVEVSGAEQVVRNWEQIKRAEKGRTSLMDDIPGSLPSLLYVHKLYRKAAAGGVEEGDGDAAQARVRAAADRAGTVYDEHAIGELLAAVVALARANGVDAEAALRGWAGEFRRRFRAFETIAAEEGIELEHGDPARIAAIWTRAGEDQRRP
jgi:tetrapyrrole methylase family protein/MazG family protein